MLAGFFFQAEDGIRDTSVTGVQTCALPIWDGRRRDALRLQELPGQQRQGAVLVVEVDVPAGRDRKSVV